MRTYIITACFMLLGIPVSAQNPIIQNFDFSITLGTTDISLEKFSLNENMDFMNYMNSDHGYFELSTIKIGFHFAILENLYTDINILVMSDLIPDNYDISLHYFFNKYFGLGAGSLYYSNYISYFEDYHKDTHPDYLILDYNQRQFESFDLGFYVSPTFRPVYGDRFKVALSCDVGLSSILEESSKFYLKGKQSNEIRMYDYQSVLAFQPYVNPKLRLMLKVFQRRTSSVGVMVNSNFFYSKKSINYNRTYQEWTSENSLEEKISSPKHRYTRFEFEGGIYFAW